MVLGQVLSLESHAALMGLRVRRGPGTIIEFVTDYGVVIARAIGDHEARIVLVGR